jgi:hypothetical protein
VISIARSFDAESEVVAIVAAAQVITIFHQRWVALTILRCQRSRRETFGIAQLILLPQRLSDWAVLCFASRYLYHRHTWLARFQQFFTCRIISFIRTRCHPLTVRLHPSFHHSFRRDFESVVAAVFWFRWIEGLGFGTSDHYFSRSICSRYLYSRDVCQRNARLRGGAILAGFCSTEKTAQRLRLIGGTSGMGSISDINRRPLKRCAGNLPNAGTAAKNRKSKGKLNKSSSMDRSPLMTVMASRSK